MRAIDHTELELIAVRAFQALTEVAALNVALIDPFGDRLESLRGFRIIPELSELVRR